MAISPGYNQFPRQRVPQISPGINSSNVALRALKEEQDKLASEEAAKKANSAPAPQKVIVVAAPPTPSPESVTPQ